MNKMDRIRELISENPTLSKRQLGKMAFESGLVSSPEVGRFRVNDLISGRKGGKMSTDYIGTRLREGKMNDFSPFICNGKRIGLLYDIHIPFHDMRAITIALNYFKEIDVDTIILGGDAVDFYQLSRFIKDPKNRITAWEEIMMLCSLIDDIREFFGPKVNIIWKFGNHEERFEVQLFDSSKNLHDYKSLGIAYVVNEYGADDKEKKLAKKRNVTVVTEKRIIKAGKLNIVHGHEFGNSVFSPVNPARGLFLKAKTNTVCGHHHQTSEHVTRNLNEDIIGCWSVGCLSDIHPQYRPINEFNLGFASVSISPTGNFSISNKKLIDYQIV